MATEEETDALIKSEIASIKARIKARENQPGFAANVQHMKDVLASLEALDAD